MLAAIERIPMAVRIDYINFYNDLGESFPKMKELATWTENDWLSDEFCFYIIFTDIAWELVQWVEEGKESDVQRFMNFIEDYLLKEHLLIISPISIDFLATIMEAKSHTRESIKSMMGPKTRDSYNQLRGGYKESKSA
jgi:hypothetical protein